MQYLELTSEIIEKDIRAFELRLQKARDTLQMLPAGYLPYPEYKKREKQRHDLTEEIQHVNYLITLANGALIDAI